MLFSSKSFDFQSIIINSLKSSKTTSKNVILVLYSIFFSWVITMVRIILVNRVLFHARDYHRLLINSAQEVKVEIPQNFGMMGRLYSGHWFLAAEKKENLL